MSKFQEYWDLNKDKYVKQAMEDYEQLNCKFLAKINIHTDNDFSLDLGYSFTFYAITEEILIDKLVAHLNRIKIVNMKTTRKIINDQVVELPDNELWYGLRDEAIMELKQGNNAIQVGGNQTITIDINAY